MANLTHGHAARRVVLSSASSRGRRSSWRYQQEACPLCRSSECGAAGIESGGVTPDERWLGAVWPFVQSWLPASPARVIEIGCGPLGGFVPMLSAVGYDAAGVDPHAPQGRCYQRVEFERYEQRGPADAVVAGHAP